MLKEIQIATNKLKFCFCCIIFPVIDMVTATRLANWAHKGFVFGSGALFAYLSGILAYNFYLNWNTSVQMSEVSLKFMILF